MASSVLNTVTLKCQWDVGEKKSSLKVTSFEVCRVSLWGSTEGTRYFRSVSRGQRKEKSRSLGACDCVAPSK